MRWSKCFIPTLRESPAGVETVSEKLLVRAGICTRGIHGRVRVLAAGHEVAREDSTDRTRGDGDPPRTGSTAWGRGAGDRARRTARTEAVTAGLVSRADGDAAAAAVRWPRCVLVGHRRYVD